MLEEGVDGLSLVEGGIALFGHNVKALRLPREISKLQTRMSWRARENVINNHLEYIPISHPRQRSTFSRSRHTLDQCGSREKCTVFDLAGVL